MRDMRRPRGSPSLRTSSVTVIVESALGMRTAHQRSSAAEQAVRQALSDETGVEITAVTLSEAEQGLYHLRVQLRCGGQDLDLTLAVQ